MLFALRLYVIRGELPHWTKYLQLCFRDTGMQFNTLSAQMISGASIHALMDKPPTQ